MTNPVIPDPAVNPALLAAQERMADAIADMAETAKTLPGVALDVREARWMSIFAYCIAAKVGYDAPSIAKFADALLAESLSRFPLPS